MNFWNVGKTSLPPSSRLRAVYARPDYEDAYCIPLSAQQASRPVSTLARALVFNVPGWINRAMSVRDSIIRPMGVQPVGRIGRAVADAELRIGEKFDAFTLFHVDDDEVMVGEDDTHLDFRLAVVKVEQNRQASLVLGMVVQTHNLLGSAYLAGVLPVHKIVMRQILSRAFDSGRL